MNKLECEFLVCGGGISGICAAISAARLGVDVILINDRSVLGGNASSEIGVLIEGSGHEGLNPAIYARENGIIEEIRLRIAEFYSGGGYGKAAVMDAVLLDMILAEKNIRLMQNTIVYDCACEEDIIKSANLRNLINNEEYIVYAPLFADCTGNGILAERAGAEYKMGREAKWEYKEKWAPDKADAYVMGNSLYFETEDVGHKVEFKAPDFAYDIADWEFVKNIDIKENFRGFAVSGPHWAYEFGGQYDTVKDCEEIDLKIRRLTFGIWNYIKNSGKYPKADTYILKRVFAKNGMRESRRFVGEYILTENDIENKINFSDSVCMGGWPMDVHAPLGILDPGPATNFIPVTGTYNIPFRILYSINVKNLMFAGRNVSATHIALGSVRVMGTCGCMGQAIGAAAAISKKYNNAVPSVIYHNHIEELREILVENDQSILHINRKCNKDFHIQAGTELVYENAPQEFSYMPLERDYSIMLMLETDRLNRISVNIKSNKSTTLNYKIMTGSHPETYLPEKIVKVCSTPVETGFCGWKEININAEKGEDSKIYIVFEENSNIMLGVTENRIPGAITARMHRDGNCEGKNHDSIPLNENTGYTHYDFSYEKTRNIMFKNLSPVQKMFSAANVVNGFSRPYGVMNLWKSQKAADDFIRFSSDYGKNIETIEIVFDNELEGGNMYAVPKTIAKDYDIILKTQDGEKIINVRDNFKRVCKHSVKLNDVKAVKINLLQSHGDKFGVYGVNILENQK